MATYIVASYCSKCDKYFRHIGRGDYGNCNICGNTLVGKCVQKYSVQDPNPRNEVVNITYKENLRYSASLGVSETQIEEARRLHPWVDWRKFGHSYRPLIKNRTDKKRLMREAGYEEFSPKDFKGRD